MTRWFDLGHFVHFGRHGGYFEMTYKHGARNGHWQTALLMERGYPFAVGITLDIMGL